MDPAIYGELHERLCAETDAVDPADHRRQPAAAGRGAAEHGAAGARDVLAEHGAAELLHPRRAGVLRQPPLRHRALRARDRARATCSPELEVYSAAMLEEVEHLLGLGILAPPYVINFVLHTPTQGGHARHAGEPARRGRAARGSACRGRTCASTSPRWADAAADDHDRDGDGLQRPRRDGGQRALPPRRAAARTTRSWSSARCGSRASSTGRSPRPAQARELLALRGREAARCPRADAGCGHEAAALRLRRADRGRRGGRAAGRRRRAGAGRRPEPRAADERALASARRRWWTSTGSPSSPGSSQRRRGRGRDRPRRPARARPGRRARGCRCWPTPPRGSAIPPCATAATVGGNLAFADPANNLPVVAARAGRAS